MGVARAYAAAGVVDGKIYVLGGCKFDDYTLCWGEMLDPKTQTWVTLPQMPGRKNRSQSIHASVVRDQKFYAVDDIDRTFYYSASQGKWERGNRGEAIGNRRDWCMIDKLLYCITMSGKIFWCEADELDWREPEGRMCSKEVKGLSSLKKSLYRCRVVHFGEQILDRWEQNKIKFGLTRKSKSDRSHELVDLLPGARLSNFGGNIVLFWDVMERDCLKILCAEISLDRRGGEIWGNIEWSNVVITTRSRVCTAGPGRLFRSLIYQKNRIRRACSMSGCRTEKNVRDYIRVEI